MSHVTEIDLEIRDLSCLKAACEALGLEWRENQKTFRWYGRHVGDYPLPAGFTKEDMGRCDHAIAIRDNDRAYEVGVCARRDGKQGYTLLWDFWAGGHGLQAAIGGNGNKLRDQYSAALATQKLRKQGFRVTRTQSADGKIVLRATR